MEYLRTKHNEKLGVILLDLSMPEMNGREIRSCGRWARF